MDISEPKYVSSWHNKIRAQIFIIFLEDNLKIKKWIIWINVIINLID